MQEVWKDIPGYEGLYQASTLGQIRSLDRPVWHGTFMYTRKGTIRKPSITKDYNSLNLSKDGHKTFFMVHRLVAMTFLPNPNNLPEVNHKDGDKLNNRLNNLEWCTVADNVNHAINTGLISKQSLVAKSRKGADKISIRIRCEDTGELFSCASELKQRLKISYATKKGIVNGRTHKGKGWLFTEVDETYYQQHINDPVDTEKCNQIHAEIRKRIGLKGVRTTIFCQTNGKYYPNMSRAAEELGIDKTSVSLAIKENRFVKGYKFVRVDEIGDDYIE